MADDKIEVIIEAQDKLSGQLKNIEKNMKSMQSNTEKGNASLNNSFKNTMTTLVSLGNIAQGVHNIFETYQNRLRTLENATDNVTNAQIRLKQAQQDLQAQFERSAITEERLNLTRGDLVKRQEELTKVIKDMDMRNVSKDSQRYTDTLRELKEVELDLKDNTLDLKDVQQQLKDQQEAVDISTNNLEKSQRKLEKAQGDAKWMYVDMGTQILSVMTSIGFLTKSMDLANTSVTKLIISLGPFLLIAGVVAGVIAYVNYLWQNWETMSDRVRLAMFLLAPPIYILVSVVKWLTENWQELMEYLQSGWDLFKRFASWIDGFTGGTLSKLLQMLLDVIDAMGRALPGGSGGSSKSSKSSSSSSQSKSNTPSWAQPTKNPFADFISRPGQPAIPFSSNDTIVGMKDLSNLRGASIVITGNKIYGTDPDDISNAIMNKIRRKIAI